MEYSCRICSSSLKRPTVTLRAMPLTDGFIKSGEEEENEYIEDILIYECQLCRFVQNPINFEYSEYYKDYNYSSGHSEFAQSFFDGYAAVLDQIYLKTHSKKATSVIEAGSGDGVQLASFQEIGYTVLGIEPSDYLVSVANAAGIETKACLFDTQLDLDESFDICVSSYTFDHMPDPLDYLQTAHKVLNPGGLVAVEIHDLEKIVDRTEFCLFEHEHTIYMTPSDATALIESQGFKVISVNPLDDITTRANSLIVVAQKNEIKFHPQTVLHDNPKFKTLDQRIKDTIFKIDEWVVSLESDLPLIGYGAGGRGVMTLAALECAQRFSGLVDSNYNSDIYKAPKTRVPIYSKEDLSSFSAGYCIIFSFGYAEEITRDLLLAGFSHERIVLLSDFYV